LLPPVYPARTLNQQTIAALDVVVVVVVLAIAACDSRRAVGVSIGIAPAVLSAGPAAYGTGVQGQFFL